jgi:hypothetical protein
MNAQQLQAGFSEVQAAIYRVALALDAFLVNGIPYGVIHRDVINGFLEKAARNLLTELASLEEQAPHAPVTSQPQVTEVLAALRATCQRLVDLVTGLRSFRTLPLEQVRATVSQIPLLREAGVGLIQQLEECFRTPQPFYPSRPAHATAAVDDFLANLERAFTQEWSASAK